jgi:hypothetical protein
LVHIRVRESAVADIYLSDASIRTPSLAAAGSCWIRMSRSAGSASPVPDANRWKKKPEVIEAIEILLEHDTAGDPITGIRWTHKTPAGIAELLRQLDIETARKSRSTVLPGWLASAASGNTSGNPSPLKSPVPTI